MGDAKAWKPDQGETVHLTEKGPANCPIWPLLQSRPQYICAENGETKGSRQELQKNRHLYPKLILRYLSPLLRAF